MTKGEGGQKSQKKLWRLLWTAPKLMYTVNLSAKVEGSWKSLKSFQT